MDPFDFFNSDSESSEDEIYDCSSSNSEVTTDLSFNYDSSLSKSSDVMSKTAFPKNIIMKLMHRETHGFFSPNHNLRNFDKVPAENCLRLSEILPKSNPRNQHVCMGLTRCGNFLITYTLQEMIVPFEESYQYKLHWWRFVPQRRCVKVASTELFESRVVDVELHVTVCQWPTDNTRLLVYGFETEAEPAGGRGHVSVLTVPAVSRCADCQGQRPESRHGRCLRHGLAVHASFDYGAPCPPFDARLSLKRDGLVIINIGHLLHVLDVRIDAPNQQVAAPAPAPSLTRCDAPAPTAPGDPAGAGSVWSDDEHALLRLLDQNFLDVNHELSIACADVDDPAYRIREGPDSPDEPRLAEGNGERDREDSRDRRQRRFAFGGDVAARPPRAETVYEFRDEDVSCERLSDLRRRRLADKRYAFSEDDGEDAENIVPYRRCADKQCDRLLTPPPASSQPPANKGADRIKATPTTQPPANKGVERLKAPPTTQQAANKATERLKAPPTSQPPANKGVERLKATPPVANKSNSRSPTQTTQTQRHFVGMRSPQRQQCYASIRSPQSQQSHASARSPQSQQSHPGIRSPQRQQSYAGMRSPQSQQGVRSPQGYANVLSPPCDVNKGASAPPKQYGGGGWGGRGRQRATPPPPGVESGAVLRPMNSNGSQPAKPAPTAASLPPTPPPPLLPAPGRPPTATGKYTKLFDRRYVERDVDAALQPSDNDEEEGEAPAYQFALLMVVLGARNEPMELATALRPGKPGAASVTVRQKSFDFELFLNNVGEAICDDVGFLFSCCVDYHVDILDVCPVSGETWCEARLRLKFRPRADPRCRFADCGCTFVINADTGAVGVVSVTSLVHSGLEGRKMCELRVPPRGPRGPPLPSAARVRVISNEGTLRYVSFTSLVDLDNLIEIRL